MTFLNPCLELPDAGSSRDASPYREVTPFENDLTDDYKESAYRYHGTLIEMGGRPTRSVLEEPVWKAVHKSEEGIIELIDEHGKRECTLQDDICPINYHWGEESTRFEQELDRWKLFQNYQRTHAHLPPLKTAFDLTDAGEPLKVILVRLNEWREFEVYHQCKVNDTLMATWRIRSALQRLFLEEEALDPAASTLEIQQQIGRWLDQLFWKQTCLDAAQKQLTCIENQNFEMLSEASASLENSTLFLCQQLERKMEEQTTGVWQELELLGARPSRPAQAASTAPCVQRILHWKLETSRLLKDHREWKIFLKWRRHVANSSTSVNMDEQPSDEPHLDPALWFDNVRYRQNELVKAKSWVVCWRRLQRSIMKKEQKRIQAGEPIVGGSNETAQEYVERFEEDVCTAKARLRLAQQQLAELTLQQDPSAPPDLTQQSLKREPSSRSPPDEDASASRPDDGKPLDFKTPPIKTHRPTPVQSAVEDPLITGSPSTSEMDSKSHSTRVTRKASSSGHKVSKARKARPGTKKTNKKAVKNSKAFTKQQTTALLNAALRSTSPAHPPPRRSERLRIEQLRS